MTKYVSKSLWFWVILIVSLGLVAACSSNPTTPDPTDVQDFSFEEGDDLVNEEIAPLLDAYETLVEAGGGSTIVAEGEGYTLIGVFEKWTDTELEGAQVVVQQAGEDPVEIAFNEKVLFTDLVYPITVTVSVENYQTQTLVETNANVIAFGVKRLEGQQLPTVIMGYAFDYDSHAPWVVKGKSTHFDQDWEMSYGGQYVAPNIIVQANPYQPVGAVAFLFENRQSVGWVPGMIPDMDDYVLLGYAYSHVGNIDPGTGGGWILNLTQEGAPNTYDPGNYTVTHSFPDNGSIGSISHGTLTITPGGIREANEEFIPYGLPTEIQLTSDSGTYEVEAYDPPLIVDRHVIAVEVQYGDGGYECHFLPWDPAGTTVPDITLGDLPETTTVDLDTGPLGDVLTFTAEWTNTPAPGMVLGNVADEDGNVYWQIFMNNDATNLTDDGLVLPGGTHPVLISPNFLGIDYPNLCVNRVECGAFSVDGFDANTVWNGTTTVATAIPEQIITVPVP
jgi:hypothetical protein